MPKSFIEHIEKYGEANALCFEGLSFDQVSHLVFTNQLDILAKSIVDLTPTPPTLQEKVERLKRCLQPITPNKRIK